MYSMIHKNYVFDYRYLLKKISCQKELGIWIRRYVDAHGFLILQNVEGSSDVERSSLFLSQLCSSIGTLVPHNPGKNDFVWQIKCQLSTSALKTFSEHNQHAPLHTDSQYRNQPERFIALMTIRQAHCGGGYTEIVDFRKILEDIKCTAMGSRVVEFIRNESFPIAIPSVFQEYSKPASIQAKLVSVSPLIRYRYDTLKAGLSLIEHGRVAAFHENLDLLDLFIQSSPHRFRFISLPNEITFLDNHRFLHGRSSFTDFNRLLLRTRMN
ncbi:TauD/TfdA family dioxygenase [Nostoc punctiforme UO1]|uniref:TauD/TfdA family dioxygenase n=1 Tax=Nostoc punctiforme TaxID=272131 RepID=UPI0030AFCFA0